MKHTQRIKTGSAFIDWTNIAKGIPQGIPKCEISYLADDNSLCSFSMNLGNIFTILIHIL